MCYFNSILGLSEYIYKYRESGSSLIKLKMQSENASQENPNDNQPANPGAIGDSAPETRIFKIETSAISSLGGRFFEVRLDLFDGPIDLLLHLVKQNELPLEKISLALVAAQYVQCIEAMRRLDLEVAGEYLVIAATLLSIKSSMLLNQRVEIVGDDDNKEPDPYEELLRRLREAEVYTQGSISLGQRDLLGIDVFEGGTIDKQLQGEVRFKPHDATLLALAFKRAIEKSGASYVYSVEVQHVSIVERIVKILDILRSSGGKLEFEQLLLLPDGGTVPRGQLVGSFLALLELCKRQMIAVEQDELFGRIYVALTMTDESNLRFSSEFDEADADRGGSNGGIEQDSDSEVVNR